MLKKILVHETINEVLETIQTKNENRKKENNQNRSKDLPAWITGDVRKFDKDEEFVTKDESIQRILIIFLVMAMLQVSIATIFVSICMNNTNSFVKKEWVIPNKGMSLVILAASDNTFPDVNCSSSLFLHFSTSQNSFINVSTYK